MAKRGQVDLQRTTNETKINVRLTVAGNRKVKIETGIGFFDHMLHTLAFWAGWDLELSCQGDLETGSHHTVEDVALTLGKAFAEAREASGQLERFGSALIPLDEALSQVAVDLSGRPYWVFDAGFTVERVGTFETTMTGHFFRSFASAACINLHVRSLYGEDAHHIIESMFKGLGIALRQALTPRAGGVASTKGALG